MVTNMYVNKDLKVKLFNVFQIQMLQTSLSDDLHLQVLINIREPNAISLMIRQLLLYIHE